MKVVCIIFLILFATFAFKVDAQGAASLRLVQTIILPNVKGRIDHMAVDLEGRRLFVAALGNNSLEVLDFHSFKHIHRIGGLNEPQGVLYIPKFKRLLVTNGGDGTCKIFDSQSFQPTNSLKFSSDADNVRYDLRTRYIYVGYGRGGLGIIDANNWKQIGDILFSGHPESFQLEGSGSRIFVNIPESKNITVIDRLKGAVIGTWTIEGARENFPMALDEPSHRLFVGCRQPPKIIVYDTESSKEVTQFQIAKDVDDIFYDSGRKQIYISCGEGFINIYKQQSVDEYHEVSKISTAPSARTSLWVPELNRLFVAVPRQGNQKAEIRVYEAGE